MLLFLKQQQGVILLFDLIKLGADIAEEIPEFGRAEVACLDGAVELCHERCQGRQLLLAHHRFLHSIVVYPAAEAEASRPVAVSGGIARAVAGRAFETLINWIDSGGSGMRMSEEYRVRVVVGWIFETLEALE